MNAKDRKYVLECVEYEGFDYAFVYYSNFEKVEDGEFHRLRKAFLGARTALMAHIGWEE